MKYLLTTILTLFIAISSFAQGAYTISGKILDSTNTQVLPGATIKIKGTNVATAAKEDGSFIIKAFQPLPITLVISSVGYKTQEFVVSNTSSSNSFSLYAQNQLAGQVVVSASRRSESILKSPVTIEKLDIRAIKESPSPTFFDALENLKGVQMTTLSIGYKVPNTRGFAGTTNSRFLQMVDGVDNISPGIGAPVANAVGPTELDIESVELIPGAASAVYGLNAINGISNLKTKNPFKYQGLSIYAKEGVNHVDGNVVGPSLYQEYAIRFAKAFNDKFAFKINAAYSHGTDWIADDQTDQYASFPANKTTNGSLGLPTGVYNPGADLVNRYGDEYNSDLQSVKLADGKTYDISRTGYTEKDLTNYEVKNTKVDASLYYKFNSDLQASYTYRIGTATNNYQRGNRIHLDGEQIQQHAFEIKNNDFFVRAYYTQENTGPNSFNFRPLAENIDLAFKKPTQWYNDFKQGFANNYNGSNTLDALTAARAYADSGRYLPGTARFDSVKNKIIHTNNWDTVGAQLLLKSSFYHIEGQYDFSHFFSNKSWQLLAGGNYRQYTVTPDGNNYINPAVLKDPTQADVDFSYYNYGGFIQGTKKLADDKLKLIGSIRVDKTEYFDPKINPRIAAVYSPTELSNFRVSWQNGYRFPTLFEGFAFVNNGGVKRLGGLPITAGPTQAFENSYLNSSVTAFNNAVNKDVNSANPITKDSAIRKEKGLLVQSTYSYIQPEHLNSFEAGYKGVLLDNKLFVDMDFYYNQYNNFIGQLDVTQPYRGIIGQTGGANDSVANYINAGGGKVKKYKLWTNSKSNVSNYGFDIGLNYNFSKTYNVGANVAFAKLDQVSSTDAFTPAFNTPQWITNISFGNREIFKNTGFNVVWHWQDAFYWNSPLATGIVPAYSTLDAQVNYRIPSASTTIKLGGTNILNYYHVQYIGGPSIGGFYYVSFTFDASGLKAKK
ncbi:TonB-dependent receptor [Ferruginibacter albus]|uniref:TonB-dependent receptor n=1 Tax=Ferruginibacter albus TaxID=2875540 RepID=UPI001CC52FA9|nr:TonB-dependent receptor [Ferruginibacter albus]UAY52987.1 TonB-dependent receptor [Ferruginibacter albus]